MSINSTSSANNQPVFWDHQRLQKLKINSNEPESLQAAAQEFASLMFQMLIKSMRDAQKSFKSELYASTTCQQYEEMFDQQLALQMAQTEKNGIVASIVKEFTKNTSHLPVTEAVPNNLNITETRQQQTVMPEIFAASLPSKLQVTTASPLLVTPPTTMPMPALPTAPAQTTAKEFASKQDFIDKLLPGALQAAKVIGMDPKLLLAQAALETGWGAKIAKLPNGSSSHNLFGIKASNEWHGEKVATKTTEYADGIVQRKTDWFRAYHDFSASMHDYVQLINNNTRYQQTKTKAHNPTLYMQALHEAGYATDPQYAQKVLQIYRNL